MNLIESLLKRLFPIHRSITGKGVRKTLKIIQELIPLKIMEIASGTKVFDWEIPDEWNITDAYIRDSNGKKIIDYHNSNLHVVGYSIPFKGILTLDELKKHLHTLPDQPDVIPYITSYYSRQWGFCLSHNQLDSLKEDSYEVRIEATLEKGVLNYGEVIIPGKSDKEIMLSTNICHPSLANNELSGPIVLTLLTKYIYEYSQTSDLEYTYRIIFIPETIGALAYLKQHLEHLKTYVIAGYVLTCLGGPESYTYLKTKSEQTLSDRIGTHILKHSKHNFKEHSFLERGSDERQFNLPGIDLPIGSITRTKYREYPEYHTSADNLDYVTVAQLEESLDIFKSCFTAIELNKTYKAICIGEPQLNKYGLFPILSSKNHISGEIRNLLNIFAYCDGSHDLLWISEKLNISIKKAAELVLLLIKNELIKEVFL